MITMIMYDQCIKVQHCSMLAKHTRAERRGGLPKRFSLEGGGMLL